MRRILLLHGWDYKNYAEFNLGDPWKNREAFVKYLQKGLTVDSPVLPGFCNSKIPERSWNLDDYAHWLEEIVLSGSKKYDAILGYSFGGAILVRWAYRKAKEGVFDTDVPKLFLVSPALTRSYKNTNSFFGFLVKSANILKGNLPKVVGFLRSIYLRHMVENPYYIHGGGFQKETYVNIVNIDLSSELSFLLSRKFPVSLFFGENDTATPPELLFKKVPEARSRGAVLKDGGHDIANTHTFELGRLIMKELEVSTK